MNDTELNVNHDKSSCDLSATNSMEVKDEEISRDIDSCALVDQLFIYTINSFFFCYRAIYLMQQVAVTIGHSYMNRHIDSCPQ